MTYQELFDLLKQVQRLDPAKLRDDVVFVDLPGKVRPVSYAGMNDGSIQGVEMHAYFLSEV